MRGSLVEYSRYVSRPAALLSRNFIRKKRSYTVEYWPTGTVEPRSRHILMRPFEAVELPKNGRINGWGATMSLVKPLGSAKISNSTEVEVEGNIRELIRDNAAFRQTENSDGEIATSSLTTLLGRVSGNSTYEVDNLIGELPHCSARSCPVVEQDDRFERITQHLRKRSCHDVGRSAGRKWNN